MNEIRPQFSTTVEPSEYDIQSQMEEFVVLANEEKAFYFPADVGKIWGLFLDWKKVSTKYLKILGLLNELMDICYNRNDPNPQYRNAWIGTLPLTKSTKFLHTIVQLRDLIEEE